MAKKRAQLFPIVDRRKLHKIGGGYAIFIPLTWFVANDIDPEEIRKSQGLLMLGDTDIRFVNPVHEQQVYDRITRETRRDMTFLLKESEEGSEETGGCH